MHITSHSLAFLPHSCLPSRCADSKRREGEKKHREYAGRLNLTHPWRSGNFLQGEMFSESYKWIFSLLYSMAITSTWPAEGG